MAGKDYLDDQNAKGMRWVDSKIKDGKGGFVKIRTNKPEEKKAAPAPAAKPAAKKKAAPKAAPKVSAKASVTATTGVGKSTTANTSMARSGAARSAANKVQPKKEAPVPGRAIVMAIKNAFTGKGETDASKVARQSYMGKGKKK
jgi:hypothetical protein